MDRARHAGISTIVATLDASARPKRVRDLKNRLVVPFRPTVATIWQIASSPAWACAMLRRGGPKFASLAHYLDPSADMADMAGFTQKELLGTFSWEDIGRMRARWPSKLVVKGVLDPGDAMRAADLGVDAIYISNHGGRQFEAAPAPVDVLGGIVKAVRGRAAILCDSGIQSGLDAAKVLALGADAVFCGRAFMYGLAALGDAGAGFVCDLLHEELLAAMKQLGAVDIDTLRRIGCRHPSAWFFG